MIAVAIVLSYGRAELGELLTMWIKQTRPTPLLVWLDGYAGNVRAPGGVHVHHAPRLGANHSIGDVRAAAVEFARALYSLGPTDGFLVLDDDDYYSPSHAHYTIDALERAPGGWTGAARVAYQWEPDQMPPELVQSDHGPGQHAAWALRMETYDRAGGYLASDAYEDTALAARIGWPACTNHYALTHVRRQYGATLSAVLKGKCQGAPHYDREQLRRAHRLPDAIGPSWRPELGELEIWIRANEATLAV
jgi:hypothetical protein